ncbi:MAG: N(4)-(beta-N-acetylglucosaminyl)-L-asparaginase, partial [Gemmatimonadetes bacterium]|nr:N(4)-(beta-N-acetylglucosaminyl)-L-asparaginase [Gemmatimonadota bacterium]
MLNRRDFLERSALLSALGFLPRSISAEEYEADVARTVLPAHFRARPCVVSSANGIKGVKLAYDRIGSGEDALDAIIAGVNLVELDPTDQSVGLGGLPNEDGVVQLDASCMHGPTRRAGAVGCLEDIATPSLVAKAVMDYTTHVLLVGEGARKFAVAMGFKTQNLLTEKSRQDWLRWKSRLSKTDNWLDHDDDVKINWTHGTINMNAVTAAGDVSSVTTTSGLAWKLNGRLGDSPIHGAGQYTDNDVGAAGATGLGEMNIKVCGGFLTVEFMRQGLTPEQAGLKTLERMVRQSEARMLDDKGRPRYDMQLYAVGKDGRYGGVSMYEGASFAVCDDKGARLERCAFLFKNSERPR